MIAALWVAQATSSMDPAPPTEVMYGLTTGGWIVMLASVGFVVSLLGWCIRRVMRESQPQKLHGQIDVDTHDVERE